MRQSTLAAIGRWAVLLPPVLIIGAGGVAKFVDAAGWRQMFVDWGYPAWMSSVTGALEVAAAVLMVVAATRFYGGVLGTLVMAGAFVTRLVHGEYSMAVLPVVAGALAGLSAWWARPEWLENRLAHDDDG